MPIQNRAGEQNADLCDTRFAPNESAEVATSEVSSIPDRVSGGSAQLRGLQAVELLAKRPATAAHLARSLGVNRSTSLRLLQELEIAGYVVRDPQTRVYSPASSWLWGVLANTNDHADISEAIAPLLSRFRDQYGEAMAYAVPVNNSMVYVRYLASAHHIALREQLGTVRPMHCSALGKAYLSALDLSSLDTTLGRLDYEQGTPSAAHGPLELRQRVLSAAAQGYAIDAGETFEGSACVAVPVCMGDALIGAVGCQGPATRLQQDLLNEIGRRLADEVKRLF
jgi:DNA-binding IclR family transcriptional regulator